MKKTGLVLLSALILACVVSAAFAGTSTNGSSAAVVNSGLYDRLLQVPSFKFKNYEYGIGYGSCPVYTAPYADAFRCANGKAQCQTNAALTQSLQKAQHNDDAAGQKIRHDKRSQFFNDKRRQLFLRRNKIPADQEKDRNMKRKDKAVDPADPHMP